MNKTKFEKAVYYFVLVSMLISIIYVIYRIIAAPSISNDGDVRTKSTYTLMLLQCIVGVVAIHIPDILEKHLKRDIPSFMVTMYIIFLYCAIFLGEVRSFYYLIPNWDNFLHTFSGMMLGSLGFSVITILNKTDKIPLNMSPFFVTLFAFCFAVTIGVFWEFYEYLFDGLLGLNMQKFMLEDGIALIGREALSDTMTDLFVDALGAFIMSVIGYISLKYNTPLINTLRFRKIEK